MLVCQLVLHRAILFKAEIQGDPHAIPASLGPQPRMMRYDRILLVIFPPPQIGEGSGFTVRPCAVLVLDLDSESDVMERVRGRRVGSTPGINIPFFTDATVGYPSRAGGWLIRHDYSIG